MISESLAHPINKLSITMHFRLTPQVHNDPYITMICFAEETQPSLKMGRRTTNLKGFFKTQKTSRGQPEFTQVTLPETNIAPENGGFQ